MLVKGPDGNLWFTEFKTSRIGRITPAGAVTDQAEYQASVIAHGIVEAKGRSGRCAVPTRSRRA